MQLPGTVIFDLDGTLVDTAPDITAALNHVLVSFGRAAVDPADVRMMVGQGVNRLLEKGFGATGGSTPDLVAAGFQPFRDYYADHIADHSRPFAGVEAALDTLASQGVRLGICTNKPDHLSAMLVHALGWTGRFTANIGADSRPYRKPDPRHLLDTIAAVGGRADDAVFVGDSETDTLTAQAARVPVVAVTFGFCDRPVRELGADALIDTYNELLPALARLTGRCAAAA